MKGPQRQVGGKWGQKMGKCTAIMKGRKWSVSGRSGPSLPHAGSKPTHDPEQGNAEGTRESLDTNGGSLQMTGQWGSATEPGGTP